MATRKKRTTSPKSPSRAHGALRVGTPQVLGALVEDHQTHTLFLGSRLTPGQIYLKGSQGKNVVGVVAGSGQTQSRSVPTVIGGVGDIYLGKKGQGGSVFLKGQDGSNAIAIMGYKHEISLKNSAGKDTVRILGNQGDIVLQNADCAEDFDVKKNEELEPGTVMVIERAGTLRESTQAYDKRVAGVLTGAGKHKPGIILDRKPSKKRRMPVALMGKVYCKVDARCSPIQEGDLLTSSSTAGHAMKVEHPLSAFGAVLGKALAPLRNGTGMIPILVTLQ